MRLKDIVDRAYAYKFLDPGEMSPGKTLIILVDPDGFLLSTNIDHGRIDDDITPTKVLNKMLHARRIGRGIDELGN